jgi:hypothetical protein
MPLLRRSKMLPSAFTPHKKARPIQIFCLIVIVGDNPEHGYSGNAVLEVV